MRTKHLILGTACGLALGVGVIAAVDAGTETADAQGDFKVTPAQLQINQKISQAAVRRSNQGLNYLAPIRTSQSDAADTGRNGVTPLANVPGSGDGWTSSQIGNAAITRSKIANEAVDSEKIAPGGVTSGDLADNSVTTSKIGAAAVTGAKIANEAVDSEKIAPGGVTSGDLADNSVTTPKIGAAAVTGAKIASGAVDSAKIADDSVAAVDLTPDVRANLPLWGVKDPGAGTALLQARGATAVQRLGLGDFTMTFNRVVNTCAFQVTPQTYAGFPAAFQAQATINNLDATGQSIRVRLLNGAGAAVDSGFAAQVVC